MIFFLIILMNRTQFLNLVKNSVIFLVSKQQMLAVSCLRLSSDTASDSLLNGYIIYPIPDKHISAHWAHITFLVFHCTPSKEYATMISEYQQECSSLIPGWSLQFWTQISTEKQQESWHTGRIISQPFFPPPAQLTLSVKQLSSHE